MSVTVTISGTTLYCGSENLALGLTAKNTRMILLDPLPKSFRFRFKHGIWSYQFSTVGGFEGQVVRFFSFSVQASDDEDGSSLLIDGESFVGVPVDDGIVNDATFGVIGFHRGHWNSDGRAFGHLQKIIMS